MLPASTTSLVVLVIVALVPAAVSWWSGRRLARHLDDPALPERLLARARRNGAVYGAALAMLAWVSFASLIWTVPLLIAGTVVAAYPLRRALFNETWTLRSYLSFIARLLAGLWGFWVLLAFTPAIAHTAGPLDWAAGAALGIVLVFWNVYYAPILRTLLRAQPIGDPELLPAFERVATRAGIPMPLFECVDLRGGAIANALALASVRQSSVLFTNTLLNRLSVDESVAICAHEIAHLEYYDRARLRGYNAVTYSLIATAVLVPAAARITGLCSFAVAWLLWGAAMAAALLWRVRNRQQQETSSDQRAIGLIADPESLVRALTAIHTLARVPRRYDVDLERRATHPSLARRIRDIRKAAGTPPAPVPAAVSVTGMDGRTTVTFEEHRLQWTEGNAASHVLNYAFLSELRLHARHSGPPALVALETNGRRWEMPLEQADVARVQAVLDTVDGRLSDPPSPRAMVPALARAFMALATVLGVAIGQIAVAVVALLAWLQPSGPLLVAAGVAAFTAAAVTVRDAGHVAGLATAVILAGLGAALILMAWSSRGETAARRVPWLVATLAACAALPVSLIAMKGMDPVILHQSVRATPAATVFLVALAGALACWRTRGTQLAAALIAIAGATTAAAGTPAFLDRFGSDPLLVRAEPVTWRTIADAPLTELSVSFFVSDVRLSPGGRHIAIVAAGEEPEGNPSPAFHIGPAAGPLTEMSAHDLTFIDDDRALLLESGTDGAELRVVRLGAPMQVVWHQQVPGIYGATLSYDTESERWRLMGWDRSSRRLARAEGQVGDSDFDYTQWAASESEGGWIDAMASAGGDALVVETRYETGLLHALGWWRWAALLGTGNMEFHFSVIDSEGRHTDIGTSRLTAECVDQAPGGTRLVCSAFDGTRTRFVAMDPRTARVTPLASMNGRFVSDGAGPGWLSGWADNLPVALNPTTREALRIERVPGQRVIRIAAAGNVVAAAFLTDNGANVRVYRTGK